MWQLSAKELAQEMIVVARIAEKLLLNPLADLHHEMERLSAFLQASENKLIRLMNHQHPSEYDPGATEFGLVLYALTTHHPILRRLVHLPHTQITAAMLTAWEAEADGAGAVDYDGSIIAVGKYEQLDAGWVTALIYYLALKFGVREVSSWANFGTTPATISEPDGNVKIALVGDWGTGNWTDGALECPAIQVINQVKQRASDYTIHLGDVYYAGSAGFLGSDQELSNFIDMWPTGNKGTFMLNSNHEMYSGAQGFFGKGLKTAAFAAQNNTSYFALENDRWILIGLDSAFYDTSTLFMNGALTDEHQKTFLRSLNTTGKKVIVLTHHNGTNIEGTAATTLWTDVITALGKAPDFWYWGHVHNAIVYSSQSFAGNAGVNARCAGSGAIPFGVAYGLQNSDGTNKPGIDYFAHELLSSAFNNTDQRQANRVLNGFTMLTLKADSITEEFLDQTGVVRWSRLTPLP